MKGTFKEQRQKENFSCALIVWHKLTEEEKGRISLTLFPSHILEELPLSIMSQKNREEVFSNLMKFAGDLA